MHNMVDNQFFINNREQLAENIKSGFVVLHSGVVKRVSTHESYSFRPNKNFYYFTGLLDPHVVAVFKMMDEVVEPFLFIPNRDSENEKWDGQQLTIQESAKLSGID